MCMLYMCVYTTHTHTHIHTCLLEQSLSKQYDQKPGEGLRIAYTCILYYGFPSVVCVCVCVCVFFPH